MLSLIPPDRLLTETDHPFGDRSAGKRARPGLVATVEQAIARQQGTSASAVRVTLWANLATLVSETRCGQLLPRAVRRQLMAS